MDIRTLIVGFIIGFIAEWILFDYFWYRRHEGNGAQTGDSSTTELTKLKTELSNLKVTHESLLSQHVDTKDKLDSALSAVKAKGTSELDALKAKHDALLAEHEALKAQASATAGGSELDQLQARHDALMTHADQLAALVDQHKAENDQLKAQLVSGAADVLDPLVDIDGIGKVFEKRLQDAGVKTFAQLGQMTPDQIREIIKPENWQKIEPEKWIEEAKSFASGAKLL